jgi:hypothetical protein
MKSLFYKLLGAGIKGISIIGGCYFGFKENDWVLGGIIGSGGYVMGTLIERLGYDLNNEREIKNIEEACENKVKGIERKYGGLIKESKESNERKIRDLERMIKNNSK